MLEHNRRHDLAAVIFNQFVAGLFVPFNLLFGDRFITAFFVGAGINQIKVKHKLFAVGAVNRQSKSAAAVNFFGLFPDTAREAFVNVLKLVAVGNADLPVMVSERHGERNPAVGNRAHNLFNRRGNVLFKLFALAFIGDAVALNLVAGQND